MALLHARVIVPGHGEVQRDNQAIDREVTLIETVRAKVEDEVARRGSISAVSHPGSRKSSTTATMDIRFIGLDLTSGARISIRFRPRMPARVSSRRSGPRAGASGRTAIPISETRAT